MAKMTTTSSRKHLPPERAKKMIYINAKFGGLTSWQLAALFYPVAWVKDKETGEYRLALHSNCQKRLKQLRDEEYLRRVEREQLNRENKPYVNAVTLKGARLLAQWLQCEVEDLDWHQIDWRLSKDYVEHHLLNNDFRVAITRATWETPQVTLERWDDEWTIRSTHASDKMKMVSPSGKPRTYTLYPDDYFELAVHKSDGTTRRLHFFVEADRGTEPGFASDENRRSWERKIRLYVQYFKPGGLYEQRYGTHTGRVLVVTTSEARLAHLLKVSEATGARQRFWFITKDKVSPQQVMVAPQGVFFDPIWQLAKADVPGELKALLDKSELGI